jgi:hypothetical protein
MSGAVASPDPLWPEPSRPRIKDSPNKGGKVAPARKGSYHATYDSPDFHDPSSDLNLFLSQKIKQEMQQYGSSKKWSHKIEDDLIQRITPEFQKQFPHYRLGVAALKKIWEKVSYYAQQFQGQKEAITKEGKLNVHFLIKENLKAHLQNRSPSYLHPYHYAHQLAMKMSDCIATIDGIRPKLDHLTKMIWALQRHLLNDYNPELAKSPYDEYDKIDKLIVKVILEISAKDPHIGMSELEHKVQESLSSLHELPNFTSLDALQGSICALLAEKLYASSVFHSLFFAEQKTAISHFILRHLSLCKGSVCSPALAERVRRVTALYTLASGLPKNIAKEQLFAAIAAIYPSLQAEKPPLPQSVYAFLAAELVFLRTHENHYPMEQICEMIWSAYSEAILLPEMKGDLLEVVIWKWLAQTEKLLEKLPYRIGLRIEEEIAGILIDNPHHNFTSLISETLHCFRRIQDLTAVKKWDEIQRKIHMWVIQGDMLCRWIRLSPDNALLKLIYKKWDQKEHRTFIQEVCQEYLSLHPDLCIYSAQLSTRVAILYKYVWYTHPSHKRDSSLDLLVQWHINRLLSLDPDVDEVRLLHQLEEHLCKTVPLAPFPKLQAKHFFACARTDRDLLK